MTFFGEIVQMAKLLLRVNKDEVKKMVYIVGGVAIVAGVGKASWHIWRDRVENRKRKEEAEKKRETIRVEAEEKRETIRVEAEEKRETIRVEAEEKRKTIRVEEEEKRKTVESKEEIRQKRQAEKEAKAATTNVKAVKIESYHEKLKNGMLDTSKERLLGFPWLREGYSTGLVAPTNCGKTTFVMQVAVALARGYCDVKMSDKWHSINPMRVALFALEQNYGEIANYYGPVVDNLHTLEIHCEAGLSPEHIMSILKGMAKEVDKEGLVVIIDNYTKLENTYGVSTMKKFCQELEMLQAEFSKTGKSLTILNVFHTNEKWKPGKPFSPSFIRGNKNNVNMTKNFIYLAPCIQGTNMRVLGYMKMKHEEQECYTLLKYAGTDIDQFCYAGEGSEKDLGLPQDEEKNETTEKVKVGRPTNFSDKQMLEWHKGVQENQYTYKQLEEEYGVKKSAIKKRVQRMKQAKKNEGDKFPIRSICPPNNSLFYSGI